MVSASAPPNVRAIRAANPKPEEAPIIKTRLGPLLICGAFLRIQFALLWMHGNRVDAQSEQQHLELTVLFALL